MQCGCGGKRTSDPSSPRRGSLHKRFVELGAIYEALKPRGAVDDILQRPPENAELLPCATQVPLIV